MDFNQYQLQSRKFALYPDAGANLWYPTLGLIDELGEFDRAIKDGDRSAIAKEAGDVFWYVAQVANEAGINLEEVFRDRRCYSAPTSVLGGVVKKIYRDKAGTPDLEDLTKIGYCLTAIYFDLAQRLQKFGIQIPDVLDLNIQKLSDRCDRGVLQGSGDNR